VRESKAPSKKKSLSSAIVRDCCDAIRLAAGKCNVQERVGSTYSCGCWCCCGRKGRRAVVVNQGGICRIAKLALTLLVPRDSKSSTDLTVAMSQSKLDLSSNDLANVPWMMVHLSMSLTECLNLS
jgi:hypothetical protein